MCKSTVRLGLFAMIVIGLSGAFADAAVIHTAPADHAVLAGGSLSAGPNVAIHGLVGAASIWMGRDSEIHGDALATGSLGVDQNVKVNGRAVAGGAVSLHKNARVGGPVHGGGDIWVDKDVESGRLTGGAGVSVEKDAKIHGDVIYHTRRWIHGDAQVAGGVSQGTAAPDTWAAPTIAMPTLHAGSSNRWFARNSDQALAPGAYGSLSVDRDSTIRLTAGEYHFQRVWLGRNVTVEADTSAGDVLVNIVTSLSTDRDVTFDAGSSLMAVTIGGSASFGPNNTIDAGLWAGEDVSVDRDGVLGGQLVAGRNVWLNQNTQVLGAGSSNAAVPEPTALATMSILGSCALLIRRGRRR